jgi:plastocyanin
MKKFILPLASLLILAFVVVGCGKRIGSRPGSSPPATASCSNGTINMAAQTFAQTTCTVKVGDAVTFVDPGSTGGYHVLCFGKDQACVANSKGPAALNTSGGVTFQAGDPPKSYTFATAGTYEVTCTVHTNMNVTITVQ